MSEIKVILIDDDKLIHMLWKREISKLNHQFIAFLSVADFLAYSEKITKDSYIFIDSDLGNGLKGEVESERISNLKFQRLYLTTGYPKNSISKPIWIKEIIGKSPPSEDFFLKSWSMPY